MLMFHIEASVAVSGGDCRELQRFLELADSPGSAIGIRWGEPQRNARQLRVSGTHSDKNGSYAAAKGLVEAL